MLTYLAFMPATCSFDGGRVSSVRSCYCELNVEVFRDRGVVVPTLKLETFSGSLNIQPAIFNLIWFSNSEGGMTEGIFVYLFYFIFYFFLLSVPFWSTESQENQTILYDLFRSFYIYLSKFPLLLLTPSFSFVWFDLNPPTYFISHPEDILNIGSTKEKNKKERKTKNLYSITEKWVCNIKEFFTFLFWEGKERKKS